MTKQRLRGAVRQWLQRPALVLVVIGLSLAAWLISRDAALFLEYARVLAWPLVVLLAIAAFRVQLVGLFENLGLKAVRAGPLSAEFSPRAAEQAEEEFDPDGFLKEFDLDEFIEEDAADSELDPTDLAISVLGLLNQAFQSQIEFLRFLRSANDGLEPAAVENWFREYLESNSGGVAEWDISALLQWLANQALVGVTPEGRYVTTPLGVHLANATDGFWYAPKLA